MVRFERVAAAFEVAAKARDCDGGSSSGSEHSPENMTDLSDLVNSFIENCNGVFGLDVHRRIDDENSSDDDDFDVAEMKESLRRLFGFANGDGGDDDVRRKVGVEVEKARRRVVGDRAAPPWPGLKRRLMAQLRRQGLDAGLCKSKSEKNKHLFSAFEYVDVNVAGTRYIIDVSLSEEFEIARPTKNYTSLLTTIPQITVCKVEELKEIVRILCRAIKKSMNQMRMPVPPWRQHKYFQAKWFGPYKQTINEFSIKNMIDLNTSNKRAVEFVSLLNDKREDFVRKNFRFKIGNLAMAMNGAS